MEIKKLRTRTVDIGELNPAPYNPRKDLQPGDHEWEKLRNSIIEFGYIDPIIWNEATGNIVGGHQRFKILKAEGVEEYEVSVVHIEDPEKEKALNIALNKTGGDWDESKLAALLTELSEEAQDLTGFDDEELDNYLTNYDPDEEDGDFSEDPEDFDPDEEVELIVTPYVKEGDIWEMGPHRIVCGDSLDPEAAKAATGGDEANLVITDPPYNVNYVGGNREEMEKLNKRTDGLKIMNDHMSDSDFYNFLLKAYQNMISVTKKGGPIYVFYADMESQNFRGALKEAGWDLKQNLIWVKGSMVMGRQDYHWQHEPVLYGWKPGAGHFWNGERDKRTVVDHEASDDELRKMDKRELIKVINDLRNDRNSSVTRIQRPTRSPEHPTMKPLDILRYYLRNSSIRGHKVFDAFLGSGSTLIAAEQMGRICYGVEKDPRYAQVIIERYIRHKENEGEDVTVIRKGKRIPYHEAALMYAEEIRTK